MIEVQEVIDDLARMPVWDLMKLSDAVDQEWKHRGSTFRDLDRKYEQTRPHNGLGGLAKIADEQEST